MNPVSFSNAQIEIIKSALNKKTSWGCDSLSDIRQYIKDHYTQQQDHVCPYCRVDYKTGHGRAWDVEHIVSISETYHFIFEPANLCNACIECNSNKSNHPTLKRKYVKYPTKSDNFKIVHPHYDEWSDHFAYGGNIYIPLTDKAHYTFYICKLFRFAARKIIPDADGITTEIVEAASAMLCDTNASTRQRSARKLLAVITPAKNT